LTLSAIVIRSIFPASGDERKQDVDILHASVWTSYAACGYHLVRLFYLQWRIDSADLLPQIYERVRNSRGGHSRRVDDVRGFRLCPSVENPSSSIFVISCESGLLIMLEGLTRSSSGFCWNWSEHALFEPVQVTRLHDLEHGIVDSDL
jgi:hypothetical protein